MKICIIVGDAVGGIRKHVHDILAAAPNGVALLYIHSEVFDATALQDFSHFKPSVIDRLKLNIKKNPAVSDLLNIFTIWCTCRRSDVDVLHGHGAKGGLYARIVGYLIGKPVIYTPHGGSVHSQFGKMKSLIFAATEYLLKFITTLFVFESQYTQVSFRKLAGKISNEREVVIYNGIYLDSLCSRKGWRSNMSHNVRLLTIGQLRTLKGQDIVINATAILKARGWNVSLDLCGGGRERDRLELLAVSLEIGELVQFHGDVSEVRPFYEGCDIVVIPSRFESFGYVAVEAALMGRPIVASATGGLLETVIDGETGLCFATGSAAALADAVEETLTNVGATQERIKAARARAVALFDVNAMTVQLYSIYRQLASCKSCVCNNRL